MHIPTHSTYPRWRAPLAVLALLLVLAACGTADPDTAIPEVAPDGPATIAISSELLDNASGAPLNTGEMAPDFEYTLPDGTTHQLSDHRGERVMINFWATWCAPCRAEMPDIQSAYNDQDFVVLAVNRNEELELITEFADQLGLSIPLIVNQDGDIGDAYGARGLPTTYFINSDGTVHLRHAGIMDREFIEQRLEEMQ